MHLVEAPAEDWIFATIDIGARFEVPRRRHERGVGLAEGVHQPLPDVRFATPGAWRPISKSPGHRPPPRFSERPTGAIWPGTTCAAAFAWPCRLPVARA